MGAFLSIAVIAFLQTKSDSIFLIAPFGASSILIYTALQNPIVQPRNIIFGHLISAFVGVSVYKFVPDIIWISAPLAVSFSIIIMHLSKSLHPPGGATALLAILGPDRIKSLGYMYVLSPVLISALILIFISFIFNNISINSFYPVNSRIALFFKTKILRQNCEMHFDISNRTDIQEQIIQIDKIKQEDHINQTDNISQLDKIKQG